MFSAGKRSHYLAFMGVPPSCPNNRNGNEILDVTVNEKLNEDLRYFFRFTFHQLLGQEG